MTPLERAKAGIAQVLGVSDAPIEAFMLTDGRMISAEAVARAVLLAIREPSEGQLDAAGEIVVGTRTEWRKTVADWYTAMIDAALGEG